MKVRDRGGGPRRAIARVASYLREAFEGLGRRMTSRRARALATALALLLSNVLAAVCPVAAYAISFEPITVERVSEDEFEEPGFSWSIDFEDAVIEPGSSFVWKDDLSGHFACDPRYDNANDPNSHWSIAKRAGGWAAYIDGDTPDDTDFTLRFTGSSSMCSRRSTDSAPSSPTAGMDARRSSARMRAFSSRMLKGLVI